MPCPTCGRLTHLSVCIHCGTGTPPRPPELTFRALAVRSHFRFALSPHVFQKASPVSALAVVPPPQPDDAACGYLPVAAGMRVVFVPDPEVAALRSLRPPPEGLAGLIALEIDAAGLLWFIFATFLDRRAFLEFAARRQIQDAAAWHLRTGVDFFAAGTSPSQLRKPFVLPLPVK